MSALLKNVIGWSVVPDFATKNGLFMIHTYIFPLLNLKAPPPNTPIYYRHYRWTFTVVVLSYLFYTLFEGSRTMQPNFYEILGVLPDVDENGLKMAFKRFAKRYHPDRPGVGRQGEELFMAVRDAFEALKNPTVRFAYDRFGSDVLQWKFSTPREYMRQGLMQSSGYHIFSGISLAVISSIGRPSPVKFWRYLLYWSFFALELSFILYSAPSSSAPITDISVKNIFHMVFPYRVPYQHILFLHQVFMFLSIAVSRVAPRLFPDDSRSEYEIVMQHLAALAGFGDREASIMLHTELHAAHPHQDKESSASLSQVQPCTPSPDIMDALAKEMEDMVIETNLQANIPPLRDAREAAIERGRAKKEKERREEKARRQALSRTLGGNGVSESSREPDGSLPSPRPSPPPPPGMGRRNSSYVRARSVSC